MANSELREKLNEFIEAEEDEKLTILQKYADDLLSDAANLEMEAWLLEEKDNEETSAKLKAHYRILRISRAAERLNEDRKEAERLADLLITWIQTDDWKTSKAYLQEHQDDLLSDLAEVVLMGLQHGNPSNPSLQQHIILLQACRELGIKKVYENLQSDDEDLDEDSGDKDLDEDSDLGSLVDDLLTTYDDEEKMTMLLTSFPREMLDPFEKSIETEISRAKDPATTEALNHRLELVRKVRAKIDPNELLTGEGYILFNLFLRIQNRREMIDLIEKLPDEKLDQIVTIAEQQLSATKRGNKAAMIRERLEALKSILKVTRYQEKNPLLKLLLDFVLAESDSEAKELLLKNAHLLLTVDARRALEDLPISNPEFQKKIDARKVLWNVVRRDHYEKSRSSISLQSIPTDTFVQNATQVFDNYPTQLSNQESKYIIVRADNCAIGDRAITINNVGRIPLEWKRPQEFQRSLSEKAVGRVKELEELHSSLQAETSTAVVGKGTSSAVQGLPGVGKSTLAALYAERYADQYPGGVLWIKLGPDYVTTESVGPKISQIAAYAYSGDAQVYEMFGDIQAFNSAEQIATPLKNTQFSYEVVKMLLSGHGSILVIVDDVWDKAVLQPIRDMLPIDGYLLVTTRDLRVAVNIGKKLELDVLSETDALQMIKQTLENMPHEQAKQLARAVGYHPLALDVALGDLAVRSADEWQESIDEIARLVVEGESLDALPLADEANRERRVEIVLRYSYDAMGKLTNGSECQKRFRALGCFAPEADFDLEMVAAIWGDGVPKAREYMNVFAARALVKRQESGRWQQHTILRAFTLMSQDTEERIRLPEQHAENYLKHIILLDDQRKYEDIIAEMPNIRHAFEWALKESIIIAGNLVAASAEALAALNLEEQYLSWSERVLEYSKIYGEEQLHLALLEKVAALASIIKLDISLEEKIKRLKEALEIGTNLLPKLDSYHKYVMQNNLAGILEALASLPGEDTGQRLHEAQALFEDMLAVNRDDTKLLSNYANFLRMLAKVPGEDQKATLLEAETVYEKILPLRQNTPLAYANTLDGYVDTLLELSRLPSQNRKQRLLQALELGKKAADLWLPIPFRHALALVDVARTSRELTEISHENRKRLLQEALVYSYKALQIGENNRFGLIVGSAKEVLANLILDMGTTFFLKELSIISGNQSVPTFPAKQLITVFLQHENIQAIELETTLNSDTGLHERFMDLMHFAHDSQDAFISAADLQKLAANWLQTKDWESSKAYLLENQNWLLTEAGKNIFEKFIQQNPGKPILEEHQALLKACQEQGVEAAYQNLIGPKQPFRMMNIQLADLLINWLNESNWQDSEAFLRENQAELLTDEAEATLQTLQEDDPEDPSILLHLEILHKCQEQGIEVGYRHLPVKPPLFLTERQVANLLIEWVKLAPDWQASQTYLSQHEEQLLTAKSAMVLARIWQQNQQHPHIKQHMELLRISREKGIEAAYADSSAILDGQTQKIAALLIEWLKLGAELELSENYIREHESELLTDPAESILGMLLQQYPDESIIASHIELLKACREKGIEQAYKDYQDTMVNLVIELVKSVSNKLIEWINTPDLIASEEYLCEHSAELLTDTAERALLLLLEDNPGNRAIEQHIELLKECREMGIEVAYSKYRSTPTEQQLEQMADLLIEWLKTADWKASEAYITEHSDQLLTDQAETVLKLLLQSNTGNEVIEQHIALLKLLREKTIKDVYDLTALDTIIENLAQAGANNRSQVTTEIKTRVLPLLNLYNHKSMDSFDIETFGRFIRSHDHLLLLLETTDQSEVQKAVYSSASFALNTLGNYYADKTEQMDQALEAYTHSLEYDLGNAMVYRNRAGVYIEAKKFKQAKDDLEKAQSLDPEAQRLSLLWRDLYLAQANGEAMLPYALTIRDRNLEEASGHYYVALAYALANEIEEASQSMLNASRLVPGNQRKFYLETLKRLKIEHPQHAAKFDKLYVILKEKPLD